MTYPRNEALMCALLLSIYLFGCGGGLREKPLDGGHAGDSTVEPDRGVDATQPDSTTIDAATGDAGDAAAQPDAAAGPTWSTIKVPGASKHLHAVWGSDPTNVYLGGEDTSLPAGGVDTVLRYDGKTWKAESTNHAYPTGVKGSIRGLWGAGGRVYAVGLPSQLVYFKSTWGNNGSGNIDEPRAIWGSSIADMVVVGKSKMMYGTGNAWTIWPSGTSKPLHAVWGTGKKKYFAVGAAGAITWSVGSSWSSMTSGTSADLNGLWGASGTDVIAVGDQGTILRYNGSTWKPMTSNTSADLHGLWGSSISDVYAVGDNGTVLRYDGASWTKLAVQSTEHLRAVWGFGPGNLVVVGDNTTVLRFSK